MVISNADIALDHISVEVRDTVGRTRIEVARLLGEPVQNSPASIGDVFQYVEVALEGIEDAEIRSVTLSFAVPNRWLDANGHEPDAITLARLSDGWIPLTTWVNGQSRSHTRFRAVSSGLSLFAIVASRSPAASGPSLPRGFRPLQTTRVLTATPAQGVPSPPTHTTRPIVPVAVPTVLPSPIAEAEATVKSIERWFFYKTWRDVANASTDGYMGISFLDGPDVGAALNCLGETYRHRALGLDPVRCDATGATVPAG